MIAGCAAPVIAMVMAPVAMPVLEHIAGVLITVTAPPLRTALGIGGGRNGNQYTEEHQ